MAVGYGSTIGPQNLNNMLGVAALAARDSAVAAEKLWDEIASLGADEAAQIAALAALAGWGDPDGDPGDFWLKANYLHAQAQLYYGQIARPDPFDTDRALAGVRAGQ